jgi:hypothetical protein
LWYQAGFFLIPPLEATMIKLSPSSRASSGWVRRFPLFRPTESTRAIGAPWKRPPILPFVALYATV